MNDEECPCEVCLVRIMCKAKMCLGGDLVVSCVRQCPSIKKYLKKESPVDLITPRIRNICYAFNVKYFTW